MNAEKMLTTFQVFDMYIIPNSYFTCLGKGLEYVYTKVFWCSCLSICIPFTLIQVCHVIGSILLLGFPRKKLAGKMNSGLFCQSKVDSVCALPIQSGF